MDIRIVNTCNNNCLYCLEQSYRKKEEFIKFEKIKEIFFKWKEKKNITFYWGNPLLHPELYNILDFFKKYSIEWVNIITNTFGLTQESIEGLKKFWLSSFWIYFNSFNTDVHDSIVGGGISLKELLRNISLIKQEWIHFKVIIHVNKKNVENLFQDVYILNKKYSVKDFEFINYFPFDRAYIFRDLLGYNYDENRKDIDKLFLIIKKLKLNTFFLKFDKAFFWKFLEFYDLEKGVEKQIGKEDRERLKEKFPFCFLEKRCIHCFIKDKCHFYGKT